MKKTILVSVITSFITVILVMSLVHLFSYCCDEDLCDYDGKHKKECELKDELKTLRAEFDQELSAEEKQLIADSREKFADFDHDEMTEKEDHEADFKALATIAEDHKEKLDAIKAKFHDMHAGHDCCKPQKDCCDRHKRTCDKHHSCCNKHKACCKKKEVHKCPEGEAGHDMTGEHKYPGDSASVKKIAEHKCPEYKRGHKCPEHKYPGHKACCEKKVAHKCMDHNSFAVHFLLMEY
jgi:hypothetical protein